MAQNFSEQPKKTAGGEPGRLAAFLRRLRDSPTDPRTAEARRLEFAALEATGRWGFASLSVQKILEQADLGRTRFYQLFRNKEDCYASGYEFVADRLATELLGTACSTGDWELGFRTTLDDLADLIGDEPQLMRALVAEAHGLAGVGAQRTEAFERLSAAVDTAGREIPSRHSPPPNSAYFILCTIKAALTSALAAEEPDRFRATIPDLMRIVAAIYLDRP